MNTLTSASTGYATTHSSAEILDEFRHTFGDAGASELLDWYARASEKHRALLRDLSDLAPAVRTVEPGSCLAELEARLERRLTSVKADLCAEIDAHVAPKPAIWTVWWVTPASLAVLLAVVEMILH